MLKAHTKLKLLEVRRIFWKKIYLSLLLQASCLGGDQLWWLLKKYGCSCLHAGYQVERKGSTCPRATNTIPHPVLYMTWETLPEDLQGWA